MTTPNHQPDRETGDVSRETMPYPALPDSVTNPEERAGYQRAASQAAAAYQWATAAAVRDLISVHIQMNGDRTQELAVAWQTYGQRSQAAVIAYVCAVTQAYHTAVTIGSR